MDEIAKAGEAVGIRPKNPQWEEMTASEDYSYMMKRVQENGGKASLMLFFTPSKVGLHSVDFSVDESVLVKGVKVFTATAMAYMPSK